MAKFSAYSLNQLSTCDPRIQRICNEAIKYFDFKVNEGHRGKADQDEAVATGASKTPWPTSKHNSYPSRAVDIVPYPIDWTDAEKPHLRFAFMMGVIKVCADQLGIKIRFGMDWNRNLDPRDEDFIDLPHFELDEP